MINYQTSLLCLPLKKSKVTCGKWKQNARKTKKSFRNVLSSLKPKQKRFFSVQPRRWHFLWLKISLSQTHQKISFKRKKTRWLGIKQLNDCTPSASRRLRRPRSLKRIMSLNAWDMNVRLLPNWIKLLLPERTMLR